jgi:putative intracellular protease/amidase
MDDLKGNCIAFVAADGFEQVELTGPRERFEKAGEALTVLP